MMINPYFFTPPTDAGLLAGYTSSIAGGYSLVLLSTLYSGPCIRVRRASDNAEQDIGFSGGVLDTASLATFCSGTDGLVTTWYDQYTSANNLVQTTAGYQPQIVFSGEVMPEIIFDGVDDYMITAGNCPSGTVMSTFLAGRARWGDTTQRYTSSRSDYAGPTIATTSSVWRTNVAGAGGGYSTFATPPTKSNSVFATTQNATTPLILYYIDGVSQSSVATTGTVSGSYSATTTTLGCKYDLSGFCPLAVRAFLVYSREVNATDVGSISTIIRPTLTVDPLQNYTSNLWGSYGLRRHRSGYAGSAIRVRRASDSTEQDIGFSSGQLDTAALASFCAGTNGFVRKWYDQSGNGNDLGQSTAANQPKIYDSSAGFLGYADFDGSNDALGTTANSGTPSAFTVLLRGTVTTSSGLIIEQSTNYNSNNAAICYFDSSALSVGVHTTTGNGYARSDYAASSFAKYQDMGIAFRADRSQASSALMSTWFLGGSKKTRTADGSVNTLPSGNYGAAPWWVGGRAGSSFFGAQKITDIAIYETAQTDAVINKISALIGG